MIRVTSVISWRPVARKIQRRLIKKIEHENDSKKRSELIGKLASVPRGFTDRLANRWGGKCWYCERKLPLSELVIEHFRPKRRVTGLPDHGGYWWLAGDARNFRIACKNCNCRWTNPDGLVAGKGNYFPLLDESTRAASRRADIRSEAPLLYDPVNASDCAGLGFQSDGTCNPRARGVIEYNRGYSSIVLYNLNNPALVDDRKKLWDDIDLIISQAELARGRDAPLFERAKASIRSKVADHATYAGNSRDAVISACKRLGVCAYEYL